MVSKEVQWVMLQLLVVVLGVLYVKPQLRSRNVEIINEVSIFKAQIDNEKNFAKKVLYCDFFFLTCCYYFTTVSPCLVRICKVQKLD